MKTNKGFREQDHADELRKAKRLAPMHKSGKERHALYNRTGDDDDEEDEPLVKRESVLDYFDDGEEEEN